MQIRYGFVDVVQDGPPMARVRFPEEDNFVTAFLPVLFLHTLETLDYDNVVEKQHVCCIMDSTNEDGVIIGGTYGVKDTMPDGAAKGIIMRLFKDGALFKYDVNASSFSFVSGKTSITATKDNLIDCKVDKAEVQLTPSAVDAKFNATEVKLTDNGVTVKSASGSLKDILSNIITKIEALTVTSSPTGGPTSVPVNVADFTAIGLTINQVFEA